MTVFTKTATNIFAPTDSSGNARRVDNAEVQIWGAEVEGILDSANLPTTIGRDVTQSGASPSGSSAANGTAFDAAADAVLSDGSRLLYVLGNGDVYDASGATLDKIHSVLLVGTADISGVYRKQVFPPNTPGPSDNYEADISPAQLSRINAAYERGDTLSVVLWGDSIGTYRPGGTNGGSGRMDLKVEAYRTWLLHQFPGATINFYNRCWGGRRYTDWDKVEADTSVYTWNDGTSQWNELVAACDPHLVISACGMNRSSSIQELVAWRAAITAMGADCLWETNMIPNLAYSGFTQSTFQLLDQEASMTRSYARYMGDGFIDFHRRCCVVRDGFDVRQGATREDWKESPALTSNGPGGVLRGRGTRTSRAMKIIVEFNSTSWADGATDQMQVGLGSESSYLAIKKSSGGFWTFQWICTGASSLSGGLFTSTLATTAAADDQFTIEFRDDVLTVYTKEGEQAVVSEDPVYSAQYVHSGYKSNPYAQIVSLTGAVLSSVEFWYVEDRLNMPLTTNKELWDSAEKYPKEGGINHPTSLAGSLIYRPVLQQLTLRGYPGSSNIITPPSDVTIASGAITVTGSRHIVDVESGTTDDLDTISGGVGGMHIYLSPASGKTVVIKTGTGNILCGTDRTLNHISDVAHLVYLSSNSKWSLVSFSDNAVSA